jgi:hypothetical protein
MFLTNTQTQQYKKKKRRDFSHTKIATQPNLQVFYKKYQFITWTRKTLKKK